MKFNTFSSIILLSLVSCQTKEQGADESRRYSEKYRPQFHFSPDHNWTNDPNGLVYSDGEYHLFYQYNPYANMWGHMSWGHAVSKDLLHWEHLPVALEEYVEKQSNDSVMIFSGSAVVDANNTSGFFPDIGGGIVAIYTSHAHKNGQQLRQHQSIAYSKDKGRTFTRYENNPVLDLQLKDFRDPKVFWHHVEKKWIMAAVIPDRYKVHFFESRDLKEWKFLSEFGPLGDTAKIWECPDLFELSMTDDPAKKKWVLLISGSHPQGPDFVGMQYFVGNFDGKKFIPDDPVQYPLYLEYGKDFYAAVTYNNVPYGRIILLGWANNWAYGQAIPTFPWKSAMSLPRELYLKDTPQGVRMVQRPIREAETLRGIEITDFSANNEKAVEVELEVTSRSTVEAGLKIVSGEGELSIIGVDFTKGEVYIDRTKSGNVDFHPLFPSVERAPVNLTDGKVKLRVFIDHSVVEVYVNDGELVLTDQVFPASERSSLETYYKGGEPEMSMKGWVLKSVWQ